MVKRMIILGNVVLELLKQKKILGCAIQKIKWLGVNMKSETHSCLSRRTNVDTCFGGFNITFLDFRQQKEIQSLFIQSSVFSSIVHIVRGSIIDSYTFHFTTGATQGICCCWRWMSVKE